MWQVWRFRENLHDDREPQASVLKGQSYIRYLWNFRREKKTSRNLYGFEKKGPGTEQTVQDTTQTQVILFLPSIYLQGSIIS